MFVWSNNKKELSKNTNKEDAVRRCIRGYECKFTAKEKLNILYLKKHSILKVGKK